MIKCVYWILYLVNICLPFCEKYAQGKLQPYFILGIEKRWREAHGCNGQSISLGCESGELIWFVRTFYGVSKREPKACFYTPGDCISNNQESLLRFSSVITGTLAYRSYVNNASLCASWADYRQDYIYCVKSKNINFKLTLTLSRQ